eukprot:CAMPEP_0170263320 /NCGR_PEP_ID=MMETSP0116_2-20130129/31546_1 /TAXON_ID=400756 /ORGANISM="Durinskia baltica, Strain CSIRO CS-38" /LENGTH=475 /DNA_ID=CAMNT_0010514395 /DNA_START=93 /DNA_END=1517 /DNA_ORIENTATION=+
MAGAIAEPMTGLGWASNGTQQGLHWQQPDDNPWGIGQGDGSLHAKQWNRDSGDASTMYPSDSFYPRPGACGGRPSQADQAYSDYDPSVFAGLPSSLFEGAVSFERREGNVVSERVVETQQRFVAAVPADLFHSTERTDVEVVRTIIESVSEGGVAVAGYRPVFMMEKVVEVPHVITREYDKYVPKPELVERLVQVPKIEVQERTIKMPPRIQYQEQIVEVPEVVIEERVVHVPRREVQERLIEVPKVTYVERIEYEDTIEYREVPVDKIVEVPEIEYVVKEVEEIVPQRYIQEYYVDNYKECPVTQLQEVERIEYVPVVVPPGQASGYAPPLPMAVPPAQSFVMGDGYPTPPVPPPQTQQPELRQPPPAAAPTPNPEASGLAGLSVSSVAGLPVGSSFLVPRGSLPRGHLEGNQALSALASMQTPQSVPAPGSLPTGGFGYGQFDMSAQRTMPGIPLASGQYPMPSMPAAPALYP